MPVNWCTSCKCVLANEEVVDGVCERCGSEVVRKEKASGCAGITKYAQRLIDDLDDVDYIERVKDPAAQLDRPLHRRGGNVQDQYRRRGQSIHHPCRYPVRSYMVIPSTSMLNEWKDKIKNWDEVEAYQKEAARKSDFERGELNKDKTGVRLDGIEVETPVTLKMLPMFVSPTMSSWVTEPASSWAFPAKTSATGEFATKFGLPITSRSLPAAISQRRRSSQRMTAPSW